MAGTALAAGQSVIVDAVHRTAAERAALADVARQAGVRFVGLWLDAPLAVLVARVEARAGDASDATAAVVRDQAAESPGDIDWLRLDASRALDAVLADALGACGAGAPQRNGT
jgi:predicted kinase